MQLLINPQKKSALSKKALKEVELILFKFLKKEFPWLEKKEISLSLEFCSSAKIKKLNNEYRKKNKVTDVLSFPIFQTLRKNSSEIKQLPVLEVGDVVICCDVAKAQAREFKITFEQENIHLLVHGFLHLIGFDHEKNQREEKIMFSLEEKLVKNIYKVLYKK
jgi:probable rRNA maturation factor